MEKYDVSGVRDRNTSVTGPEFFVSNFDDLQVAFIIERNPPLSYIKTGNAAHSHSSFELQLIIENTFEELIENARTVCLEKGELMLIPPHVLHKTKTSHTYGRYCINFFICPNESEDNVKQNSLELLFSQINQELIFTNKEITHCFEKIFDSVSNDELTLSRIQLYLSLVFMEVATHLNTVTEHPFEPKPFFLSQHQVDANRKWLIDAYVSHYYMHKNHVEALARILNLSARHTNRIVKTLTGYNLQDLVLRHRMSIAVENIKYTDASLGQISELLGYSTYSGFYTAFCKYHGFSPDKLRENTVCNSARK